MIETGQLPKDLEAGVIEKICSAFPFTAPPAGESLVNAEIEHLRKCDECREAQQFFTGKSREIILSDEQNFPHLVNAFQFFHLASLALLFTGISDSEHTAAALSQR